MNLQVQCYAGRKADERPVGFQLGIVTTWWRELSISGTVRVTPSTKSVPPMGISTFCATTQQQTNGDSNLSDDFDRLEESERVPRLKEEVPCR